MGRIILMALIVILMTTTSYADISVSKAYITMTIINDDPVITNLFFEPANIYEDTDILCMGNVSDEHVDIVFLKYKWFVNYKFISNASMLKHDYFKPDDIITCELTANDKAQDSIPINISIIATKTPFGIKLQKYAINLIGVNADSNNIKEISNDGISGITGLVISEIKKNPEPARVRLLFLALLVVLLVTVNIFIKSFSRKKTKFPTQG